MTERGRGGKRKSCLDAGRGDFYKQRRRGDRNGSLGAGGDELVVHPYLVANLPRGDYGEIALTT